MHRAVLFLHLGSWGRCLCSSHTWSFICRLPPQCAAALGPQPLALPHPPSAPPTAESRVCLAPWWRHLLLQWAIYFIKVGDRRSDLVPVCPEFRFMLMSSTVCLWDPVFLCLLLTPPLYLSFPPQMSAQWTSSSSIEVKTTALHTV